LVNARRNGVLDYQNDEQLNHDNAIYPVNRKDREIMQKGIVRATKICQWRMNSVLHGDQSFLLLVRVSPKRTAQSLLKSLKHQPKLQHQNQFKFLALGFC